MTMLFDPNNPDERLTLDPPTRLLGLPSHYGGLPQTGIASPRLTDDTIRGLYHATAQVPSQALSVLNRVSARIGAPALSGGSAPMTVKQVYAGPPGATPVLQRAQAFVTGVGSQLRDRVGAALSAIRR